MKNIKNVAVVGFIFLIGSCNLLFARTIPTQVTIQGRIAGDAFSPDGRKIASTTPKENKVNISSSLDGSLLRTFNVISPRAVYWNRNSKSLLVSSIDTKGEMQTTLINLSI